MFCEGRFTELGVRAQDRFIYAAGILLSNSDASFTLSTHRTLAITESLVLACDGPTIRFRAPKRQEQFGRFFIRCQADAAHVDGALYRPTDQ
jgi:hypothetical protein